MAFADGGPALGADAAVEFAAVFFAGGGAAALGSLSTGARAGFATSRGGRILERLARFVSHCGVVPFWSATVATGEGEVALMLWHTNFQGARNVSIIERMLGRDLTPSRKPTLVQYIRYGETWRQGKQSNSLKKRYRMVEIGLIRV